MSESGEDTTFPSTWRDAWNWARVWIISHPPIRQNRTKLPRCNFTSQLPPFGSFDDTPLEGQGGLRMRGTNHRRLLLTEKCRPRRDGDIVLKIPFMRERTPTGDFDQA